MRRNWATKEETLDWLTTHWDYLRRMTGEKSIEDYPRLTASTIKTAAEAAKFFNFFDQYAEEPVLARTLKVAKTEVDARLALINSDKKSIFSKIL